MPSKREQRWWSCASTAAKLDRLHALGADHLINYAERDFVQEIYALYGKPSRRGANIGNGLDVVVNFTGGDTWVKSLRCLKVGGRLLTCGATAGYDPKEDIRFIWTFELEIRGSNGWQRSDIEALLEMVRQGELNTLVERTYTAVGSGRGAARDRGSRRVRQDRGDTMSEALTAAELQERLGQSPFIRFLGLIVTEADPARQQP